MPQMSLVMPVALLQLDAVCVCVNTSGVQGSKLWVLPYIVMSALLARWQPHDSLSAAARVCGRNAGSMTWVVAKL